MVYGIEVLKYPFWPNNRSMIESDLLKHMLQINTWWNNLPVPITIKKSGARRKLFFELSDTIARERIIAITGPRQVGKTTLMGQLIEHQIENKVPPSRIIYIPVDNEMLKFYSNPEGVLMGTLTVYSKRILGEEFSGLDSPVFVYLDEIQDMPNWAKTIKSYFDTFSNLHFIITGSSHTMIQKGIWESLVGRIRIRTLLPLKFTEYITFRMNYPKNIEELFVKRIVWPLRTSLRSSVKNNDANQFWSTLERNRVNLDAYKSMLVGSLRGYLVRGGFPHSIKSVNDIEAGQNLKQDLDLTIYKDVNRLFKTRDPSKLMELFLIIAKSSGRPFSQNQASKLINSDWKSVDIFMSYFEQLFLITKIKAFGTDESKSTKSDIMYISDNGIRNIALSQLRGEVLIEHLHDLYTTAAASHITRLKLRFTDYQNGDVYYWEDGTDYIEFIIDYPNTLPVTVCTEENLRDKKKATMNRFIKNHNAAFGIILTIDTLEIDDKVICMPMWMFLAIC